MSMSDDDLVRLVTARFMPGRFPGRGKLQEDAARGDLVALAKLEMKLGLAGKNALRQAYERHIDKWVYETQEHFQRFGGKPSSATDLANRLARAPQGKRLPVVIGAFARHQDLPSSVRELIPPEEIKRIQKLQHERYHDAAHGYDVYWRYRTPYHLRKEDDKTPRFESLARNKLHEALLRQNKRQAGWRSKPQHVVVVPRGEERVVFEKLPAWFMKGVGSGWGGALKKEWFFDPEGYTKTTWYISRALMNRKTRELQMRNRRHVYLSPTKRIGKSHSELFTEVLEKPHRRLPLFSDKMDSKQLTFPWGRPRWVHRRMTRPRWIR